jgi:hypothetical protein
LLAHLGGWAAWDVTTIRAVRDGETPDWDIIHDVDSFNEAVVARRCGWSMSSVLAELRLWQFALEGLLAEIPCEETFDCVRFQGPYWPDLAGWLQVAWEHELEHAAQVRRWGAAEAHTRRPGSSPERGESAPSLAHLQGAQSVSAHLIAVEQEK